MMGRIGNLVWLFLLAAAPLYGQSEARLKQSFEGRMVRVKIDMPATKDGVDVYLESSRKIDYSEYAKRLKRHGTAVKAGETILVTKVKVKDKLIEFQLGGGGYGTFGDVTRPHIPVPYPKETRREKNLKKDLENTTDPEERSKIKEELDDLRKEREREYARLQAETAEAQEVAKQRIRGQALAAGSRFNLRFPQGVPYEGLTPEAIMEALADFVEFPHENFAGTGESTTESSAGRFAPSGASSADLLTQLRKGMTKKEVAVLLGPPESQSEGMEGTLKVETWVFRHGQMRVQADFVEDVLVRYSISSN